MNASHVILNGSEVEIDKLISSFLSEYCTTLIMSPSQPQNKPELL